MTRLAEIIRDVLSIDPAAGAIEFDGNWWSWGDLDRTIAQLDALLQAHGLGEGTRVAGIMRNRPSLAAALVGIIATGRTVVTLNPGYPDARLAEDIAALRPPVVIASAQDWARPAVREACEAIGCLGIRLGENAADPLALVPGLDTLRGADLVRSSAPGVGIEMLTSGTTGPPKRIPLQSSALEQAVLDAGVYDNRAADEAPKLRGGTTIFAAPLAHISGVFGLFNAITAGRRLALIERFEVARWLDLVRRHRPAVASTPPAAVRMILDAAPPREDLASLKALRAGTAALDPDLADAFLDRYGIPVLTNYSATEFAGAGAGWTIDDFRRFGRTKRGSVGRVNPGIEARVVDPQSDAVLPAGDEGLLHIRSPRLNGGEWLATNDLAVLDDDGFLWIKGRADNVIIRGGFKIFPEDIVRAMEQHPAVLEAAVAAVPDPRLGEVPVAGYLVRQGATAPSEDEMRAFLRERLISYQLPVILRALDALPRTPSLKVSQPDLRAMLTAQSQETQ